MEIYRVHRSDTASSFNFLFRIIRSLSSYLLQKWNWSLDDGKSHVLTVVDLTDVHRHSIIDR